MTVLATTLGAADAAAQVIAGEPMQSTRAESMGGAIPTVADDKDALFENPAGIGGTRWGKAKTPWVKKLYFPFASVGADPDSTRLSSGISADGAVADSVLANAATDANAGKRQYARVNTGVGLVIGRMIVVPYYDTQIAAAAKADDATLVETHQVSTSGVAFGTSVTDASETLALGYSGYLASRSDLSGDFLYTDLADKDARAALTKANTTASKALGHNVGVTWRMGKRASPALAIVLKDVGGTKYKVSKGPGDTQTVKQDLTAGFSVSPQLGGFGEFNASLAADRLLDSEVSFVKKYHVGAEMLLFGVGSYARVGLRGGLNDAGASGGVTLNLGLIGFEAGINSVDIGVGNAKLVEHRRLGTAFVNVADF